MTVGLSAVNLANAWLNTMRGGGVGSSFTAPATLFVELHTADPGASGTTSVSVGSTTRNSYTEAAASAGSMALSSAPAAWTNGGTSETITHIAVFSAASAGTFYFSAALTTPKAWASADTFTLNTLTFALTPIAA